jgi:hypothetical protein
MRIKSIIFNNFWPKVIALILAILTWFFVFDLVTNDTDIQKKEKTEGIIFRR